MAEVTLKHIKKVYPNTEKKSKKGQKKSNLMVTDEGVLAVQDFNLDIKDREFIVLVGPSGCGKSTTLRMVAGLEEISGGELLIDGKRMNDVAPKGRDIAMVFQSYALYPHMTVRENMEFPLKLRKMPKDEMNKRVDEVAEILDITQYLDRKPKALSGGQRQRVAIGRAIVREPKVLLMDEPLSNLDAKLRVQMRSEISSLHNRLGATIIYVTHDQTEAMTLGTRIVVLKDGVIMQVDSPQKLYNQPNNLFVAGFIGSPQMNFVDAQCVVEGAKAFLKFDKYQVELPEAKAKKLIDGGYAGKNVVFGIRPEDIYDSAEHLDKFATCKIDSDVTGYELLGAEVLLYFTVAGANMSARVDSDTPARYGDHIELAFDPNKIHVFDKETELTITN